MKTYPSYIVNYIVRAFPQYGDDEAEWRRAKFDSQQAHLIQPILDLHAALPQELIVLEPSDQTDLILAISNIAQALDHWHAGRGGVPLKVQNTFNGRHPIEILLHLLMKCPDEAPAETVAGFEFVQEGDLRSDLRLDLSSAYRALSNGEWKAATVLAASVIEALLIWRLGRTEPTERSRYWDLAANAAGKNWGQCAADILSPAWSLDRAIQVAARANFISPDTETAALQSKNYRNLIHPGRAERIGAKCGADTAHFAIGAAEAVVRDLARRP